MVFQGDTRTLYPLAVLAGLVILVAGLRAAGPLIQPLLISVFIAVIALPLLNLLERQSWCPRPLAILLTVIAVLAVMFGMATLLGGSVNAFTAAAPRYQARLQSIVTSGIAWLQSHRIEVPEESVTQFFDFSILLTTVGDLLKVLATVFSRALIILLTTIFILFEATIFPEKMRAAFGAESSAHSRFNKIRTEIQRYLVIKTTVSAATGVLIWLSLTVIGVDFALMWGIVAFALNYIPSLGSIIAALPTVLLTLVQLGPGHALVVAIVYLVVNVTLGNFVEPMLMGRRLGLSPLVVFTSMVFWGWVWGPLGMLVSVPLTMIIKIMLEYTDEFRWLAILLDARAPDDTVPIGTFPPPS